MTTPWRTRLFSTALAVGFMGVAVLSPNVTAEGDTALPSVEEVADCPEPDGSPSPSAEPSPEPEGSPSPSAEPSPEPEGSPSPSAEPSPEPEGSPSPSAEPSPEPNEVVPLGPPAEEADADSTESEARAEPDLLVAPRAGAVPATASGVPGASGVVVSEGGDVSSDALEAEVDVDECPPLDEPGAEDETAQLPACTWSVLTSGSPVALMARGEPGHYSGQPLNLVSDAHSLTVHVRPVDGLPGDPCTWEDTDEGEFALAIRASGNSFVASSQSAMGTKPDEQMSFVLHGGDRSLTIDIDGSDSCSSGFNAPSSLALSDESMSGVVLSADQMHESATCTLTLTYRTQVPGGLMPEYPGTRYSFIGPRLEFVATTPWSG